MTVPFIGIDFDNTIVCYDEVFHQTALERELIPAYLPQSKEEVRDYLRRAGREDAWTELQGYVYGCRMNDVRPFPGALECIGGIINAGYQAAIVSHKTRIPYRGHPYDLHGAAREWLEQYGFFDPTRIGLDEERIFFLETKQLKLEQIDRLGCTGFIDDLPELLLEKSFPGGVERLLFDPAQSVSPEQAQQLKRFASWDEISSYLGLL